MDGARFQTPNILSLPIPEAPSEPETEGILGRTLTRLDTQSPQERAPRRDLPPIQVIFQVPPTNGDQERLLEQLRALAPEVILEALERAAAEAA
jgi:hypothetical protein